MTPEESDLINGLFERLRNISPAAKDADAEQSIRRQLASQPDAPYYLVQALLVQEHALQNAQLRIAQLQQQVAAQGQTAAGQGGSFLSGLFHRNQPATPPPLPAFPTTAAMIPSSGGGFLRGALATAAGVAGGSLLFQGIEDLLGHRAGAFGPMLGGGFGGFGGGGIVPPENVEVVNNYYDSGNPPSQGNEPGATAATDPGLGVDWGSNIDPGPAPDPGGFDPGGDSGNMAV